MSRKFALSGKKVWVAGETGLVGRNLTAALRHSGCNLLFAPHSILDLTNHTATFKWLLIHKPDVVFLAAARVGGIGANSAYPADFIRDNLSIAQNVIEGAHRAGVERLVFLGSSCIYPRDAEQPITETALMTGPLEPTNEAYAIAKIAGLKLCEFYRRQYGCSYFGAMPTNLYGPHDRFDAFSSHVIPAMMMKFHEAKILKAHEVTMWGTGTPLREFLHAGDLAQALIHYCEHWDGENFVNIGSGEEISIATLAGKIAAVTGFNGRVIFDGSKPDGTPRKLLDSSRVRSMGWRPLIDLDEGLRQTYAWYSRDCAVAPVMARKRA